MKAQILTATTVLTALSGFVPARAADQQLLNLLMPDAKVVAGVNVDQAKTSPFGQYVLLQMQSQDQNMRELAAQTGFDPTRDVHELLVASSGEAGKEETQDQRSGTRPDHCRHEETVGGVSREAAGGGEEEGCGVVPRYVRTHLRCGFPLATPLWLPVECPMLGAGGCSP